MDNNLLNKYKEEMLKMYRSVKTDAPVSQPSQAPLPPTIESAPQNTAYGSLLGIVTAVRGFYPVKNATVTVFTGDADNMQIIDTALTDESGKTKAFILPTPERSLSLDRTNTLLPYANYNMLVEADGYIKNIHLNIPVFSTVTSLQQSNLLLSETAGENKSPQVFDEAQNYDL